MLFNILLIPEIFPIFATWIDGFFKVCYRLFRLGVHLLVTPWLSVKHSKYEIHFEIICLHRYAINLMQCNGGTILIK